MFRIDWIEKYLSRVRPWHVLAVWGPLVGYLEYRTYKLGNVSLLAWVGLTAGGIFFWTFLEYLLHRYVFHFPFNKNSPVQHDLGFLIHGIHHDYPSDPDRLVMPPVITALVAVIIGTPLWFLLGPGPFHTFFAATVAGYLWYDLAHYAAHHNKPRTSFGKMQKSYHLRHHFQTPNIRYGVTTPFWDYVFGTQPKGEEAKKLVAEE
jgi:sterol desaturase/sphingolipid hydroxylase (fatty acid hydroxylase superfamily)